MGTGTNILTWQKPIPVTPGMGTSHITQSCDYQICLQVQQTQPARLFLVWIYLQVQQTWPATLFLFQICSQVQQTRPARLFLVQICLQVQQTWPARLLKCEAVHSSSSLNCSSAIPQQPVVWFHGVAEPKPNFWSNLEFEPGLLQFWTRPALLQNLWVPAGGYRSG